MLNLIIILYFGSALATINNYVALSVYNDEKCSTLPETVTYFNCGKCQTYQTQCDSKVLGDKYCQVLLSIPQHGMQFVCNETHVTRFLYDDINCTKPVVNEPLEKYYQKNACLMSKVKYTCWENKPAVYENGKMTKPYGQIWPPQVLNSQTSDSLESKLSEKVFILPNYGKVQDERFKASSTANSTKDAVHNSKSNAFKFSNEFSIWVFSLSILLFL